MASRPLGMYLVCGFFALVGLGNLFGAISIGKKASRIPAGHPQSIQLFLTLTPIFMILLGFLGLFTALALWLASPLGRTSGLIWVGLWIAEEIVVGIWMVTGPPILQQVSNGVGGNLVRLVVGGILFYYLWTTGATYVENYPMDSLSISSND